MVREITDSMVECARNGDPDAWTELYNQYQPYVISIVRSVVGRNDHMDEDLTQEVFLKVFQHLHSFRGDAAFSTWLYRVTANICLNYLEQKRQRVQVPLEDLSLDSHEDAVISSVDLQRLLAMLTERQRDRLVMHEMYGMTYAEVGAATGIQEDSSRAHVRQARRRAKQISYGE